MIEKNWSIDGDIFIVLMNAEGQHSLWPSAITPPEGWLQIGPTGSKVECLSFVEEHWIDMRPKSLLMAMSR